MAIKLIRYADEGFVNKDHSNFSHTIGEPLIGCFAFIEKEELALLSFKKEYLDFFPELKGRTHQQRHEIVADEDSMVYVKNIQVAGAGNDLLMEKDSVYIPQEPIVKSTLINGQEFPLNPRMYVKVSLDCARKRLDTLKEIYAYIESVYKTKELSVNTQYADYCECIVNMDFIRLAVGEETKKL